MHFAIQSWLSRIQHSLIRRLLPMRCYLWTKILLLKVFTREECAVNFT